MKALFSVLALSVLLSAQQNPGLQFKQVPPGTLGLYSSQYRFNGPAAENSLRLTPGAVRTTDKNEICTQSTRAIRHVSSAVHHKVFVLYGIDCKKVVCGKTFEVDHLISLELGGTNDIGNLWPQSYLPVPGARQKDVLENAMHKLVCNGTITPQQAQQEIARDWYGAYKKYVHKADGKLGR